MLSSLSINSGAVASSVAAAAAAAGPAGASESRQSDNFSIQGLDHALLSRGQADNYAYRPSRTRYGKGAELAAEKAGSGSTGSDGQAQAQAQASASGKSGKGGKDKRLKPRHQRQLDKRANKVSDDKAYMKWHTPCLNLPAGSHPYAILPTFLSLTMWFTIFS